MMVVVEMTRTLVGIETEAFGADPSQIDNVYQFRYRVVDLDDVIPSHTDTLIPNPDYLQELQPRLRDRAASRIQIENIARNLNPRALLQDSGFIDTGPMIVGSDLMVESGNGRVLANVEVVHSDLHISPTVSPTSSLSRCLVEIRYYF